MTTDIHRQLPDPSSSDELRPRSRRTVLRRSLLGITAVGLASVLAACGDDDEGGEDEVETIESEGEDVVDEVEDEADEVVDEVEDEGD